MSKLINIGVIGLGGAGRAHIRRLNRNSHVGKIFGFDIKKVTDISGVSIVQSLEDLFKNVDAVTVCTPDHSHFDDIVKSLKAGKHVLTEKPMVATYDEALRLGPYLKRFSNLVFGVHHQMRCSPAFLKAYDLIKENKLGKLFYIEANYWHDMRERYNQFDNWRGESGQSLIFAHGCHPLDLLTHLIGEAPVQHSAFVSKNSFKEYRAPYTSATILLQFPGNITGKVHVNSSCVYPQLYDLIVMGDKGTYMDGVLYTADKGFRTVAGFFGNSGWFNTEMIITKTKIMVPSKILSLMINIYMRTLNKVFDIYMRIFSKLTLLFMREGDFGFRKFPLNAYNHDYACQYIIDNFIQAVLGKEKIIATYEEATQVIGLCEALEKEGLANLKSV